MCVVYIPPNKVATSSDDLLVYLKSISHHGNIITLTFQILIAPFSNDFCDFIFDNNLVQLVCGPTHNLGNQCSSSD